MHRFTAVVLRQDLGPGDSYLEAPAIAAIQVAVLDVDVTTPDERAAAERNLAASGYLYAIYSTFSWTPENPKFKVVVPLSHDAPVDLHHHRHAGLAKIVGIASDASAGRPAQRQFVASQPQGEGDGRPAPIIGGSRLADPDELAAAAPGDAQPVRSNNKALAMAMAVNSEALIHKKGDNRARDFTLIAKECPLSKAFMDGAPLTYDEWRAVVGILKFCLNGEALFHQYSALDPCYDRDEAQRKWDGWGDGIGPTTCGKSTLCAGCTHNGTLKTPLQLADIDNEGEPAGKRGVDTQKAIEVGMQNSGLSCEMDASGALYVVKTSMVNGRTRKVLMRAESQAARDAIIAAVLDATGKAVSSAALDTCFAKLRNNAREKKAHTKIYHRVAEKDGVIHKRLRSGFNARVDASSVALVDDVEDVPFFMGGTNAGDLPDPVLSESQTAALVFLVSTFLSTFGLPPDSGLILIAAILESHRTTTPYPIIEVVGPAGCGKSTLCDAIAAMVDPSGDGGRITVGPAVADIAAAAQGAHLIRMDNIAFLDPATRNVMCIVSTGGTLVVRLLYAQSETANLTLHRVILINGVSPVCTAPDLQERVVRFELSPRRDGFIAEGELRSSWQALLPKLQGALLTLLVGVLRELPAVRASGKWQHRQVDFDQLGEAMVQSAGLPAGKFLTAVGKMRGRMARRTASGDLFLMALIKLLKDLAGKPTHTEHVDVATVARGMTPALAVVAYDENRIRITVKPETLYQRMPLSVSGGDRSNVLPATPRGLTDAIRRVQPMLSGLGINVDELTARGRSVLRFDFPEGAVHEN